MTLNATDTLILLSIVGSIILFGGAAVLAMGWAFRDGQFENFDRGAQVDLRPGRAGRRGDRCIPRLATLRRRVPATAGTRLRSVARPADVEDVMPATTKDLTPAERERFARRARRHRRVCRVPVLYFVCSAVFWLVVGSFLAFVASVKLHSPYFLARHGGAHLRPGADGPPAGGRRSAGRASSIMAAGLWLMCRLSRVELHLPEGRRLRRHALERRHGPRRARHPLRRRAVGRVARRAAVRAAVLHRRRRARVGVDGRHVPPPPRAARVRHASGTSWRPCSGSRGCTPSRSS